MFSFVCAVIAGFVYYYVLVKKEQEQLRILQEMELKRTEKLRREKLRALKNEREELLLQRDLYNRLASLNSSNEYTTKNEKDLKKSIAIHKNILSIDKKITQINNQINSPG